MSSQKESNKIVVRGATEHNLKNVDIHIPRETLTVFTGVSGSGKSSLAFDTIFKEGQRRFVESLSAYARQFLAQAEKPQVEYIAGLGPTISVDQKTVNRNPRSTVGTITEIYDHYRLLFSRLGEPYCPKCQTPITTQTPTQITDYAYLDALEEQCLILAPMVQERKGEYRKEMEEWLAEGYLRARIDGKIQRLDEKIELARYEKHSIALVIDRLTLTTREKSRFTESVERALRLADGLVIVNYREEDHLFSQALACPTCQFAMPEMEPRLFSFNAPQGACPSCKGLGTVSTFVEEKLCDPNLSIDQGALLCLTQNGNIPFTKIDHYHLTLVTQTFEIDRTIPWKQLSKENRKLLLFGNSKMKLEVSNVFRRRFPWKMYITKEKKWPGIVAILQFVSRFVKSPLEKYQETKVCPDCHGKRLNPVALAVRFHGHTIDSINQLSIEESKEYFNELALSEKEIFIGKDLFREINSRLQFLHDVGVGYLTLNRSANTLSGGEGQRIRLASQVGSGLQGVLYVLDEPSIGLHQSDNQKLIQTLQYLRDKGNTVLVVEHDEETIASADFLIDIGPTAGMDGGHIIAQGSVEDLIQEERSVTGRFLGQIEQIEVPAIRRRINPTKQLIIHNAKLNNLKEITVGIPLGVFVAVAGVSGSGKSSLIDGILKQGLSQSLNRNQKSTKTPHKISGIEQIDRVIEIDQSPIGRTPRSNPVTYTKVFDHIRDLFASVPEAKARGYQKGRFSFNVKGGRCEECRGAGIQVIEMQFLNDVEIPCDTCGGKRFNTETLQIRYKDKNIFEILDMTIDQASKFFENIPKISHTLKTLQEVGLGYIKLGQPSTTLSGGEAQRIKLASELRKKGTGKTMYLLDEPTTGLHFQDIQMLLQCLQSLVDQGNTVLVIEHNLDVLKVADHILELGPGGGKYGGEIVCAGTPEEVAEAHSLTGQFLAPVLQAKPYWQVDRGNKKVHQVENYSRDIVIQGASKNNLRHINVEIPVNQITVITGVSGSGKTSLAFDTIFAEGQARYLESLSTYARRFLGRMDKAPVDHIDGLSPAIAISQKTTSHNPRSIVATTTEIYDYLRLLFARIGIPHCPISGKRLKKDTPTSGAKYCVKHFDGKKLIILAPLYRPGTKHPTFLQNPAEISRVIEDLQQEGFVRLYVGKKEIRLDEWSEKKYKSLLQKTSTTIDLVIDRIQVSAKIQKRIAEAIETAYAKAHGIVKLFMVDSQEQEPVFLSEMLGCVETDFFQEEALTPRMFSFNSHVGACPVCDGLGEVQSFRGSSVCSSCHGQRLKPEYLAVKIQKQNISEFCMLSVLDAQTQLSTWKLTHNEKTVAEQALIEIQARLRFLVDVGLGYLRLNQKSSTLSGGEAQRIRLASQIGSGLVGVMYVLDEPTIGLHARDTARLLKTLTTLRDLGNTVILVEHDLDTIQSADHIIDVGPGAGFYGGDIVATGTPKQLTKQEESLTGQYLGRKKQIELPQSRRSLDLTKKISIYGATENNLKNLNVDFPLRVMTVVTGVSGSGKSSLVIDVLQKALQKKLHKTAVKVGEHQKIEGWEQIDKLMVIDQEPISSNPRSNPATYTKVLDPIRDLFAKLPSAQKRGYTKRRFSFNSREGRCPACEGRGKVQIEMHFLSDVWIDCEVCHGKRYNPETLAVAFKGYTIADILDLEVNQAVSVFENQPRILRICKTLQDVGLGYMKLGQAGNTLSGGEAQRLKLASELSKRSTGNTVYILDEPTTGLHIEDVAKLLQVLQRLVDQGNTVIVIEHNLEVIKTSDYIIDLGPEGGDAGGEIVFCGKLEEIAHCQQSHTGTSIAPLLVS